ncbi:MAG: hypothetical protein JXI43_10830 [Tissierellales bacterium]|nr:hypothetical protein [Tissierellales bacterium]
MLIKVTPKNFDSVLKELLDEFNEIREVPLWEAADGEVIEFHEVNRAMVLSTNRVRAIGKIYGKIQQLETDSKRWYEGEKAKANLRAVKNRKAYPDQETRKSYAVQESEKARKRYEGVKSIREMIHIERQDQYDYRQRLETVSKNLQAEAYAGR